MLSRNRKMGIGTVDHDRRKLIRALALAGATVIGGLVAGCGFQPLYGPTANGQQLTEVLKAVEIAPIPGRVGQRVRNELIFGNTGGGSGAPSQYRLQIAIRQAVQNVLVTKTGESQGKLYELTAKFKLIRMSDGAQIFTGTSLGRAAFDSIDSGFADIRARRDAENRAARAVAGDIQTKLAAFLSQGA